MWRWRVGLLLVTLIGLSLLAGPLLVVEDSLRPADAIVVIGGDHKPQRTQRAAELSAQGYAPILLLSAGTLVQEGTQQLPEAEVMRRQALALGIPEHAIILETESRSMYRNATYSRQHLQQLGFDDILLVTSAYHSRRARRIFNVVMGNDIHVSMQPAHGERCPLCWPLYPDEASVVFYEYWNWARYWLDASYFGIE
jgi:uncharacterized SAM-binding protein YcdF (DUF218 family)